MIKKILVWVLALVGVLALGVDKLEARVRIRIKLDHSPPREEMAAPGLDGSVVSWPWERDWDNWPTKLNPGDIVSEDGRITRGKKDQVQTSQPVQKKRIWCGYGYCDPGYTEPAATMPSATGPPQIPFYNPTSEQAPRFDRR